MAKSNADSGVSFLRDPFWSDRCINCKLRNFFGRDDDDPDGWSSREFNGSSEVHGRIPEVVGDLSRRTCERSILKTVSSLVQCVSRGINYARIGAHQGNSMETQKFVTVALN